MVTVGIRQLKSRLSYYVQLVEAGELIAIQVRNRVVGFFSNVQPETVVGPVKASWKKRDLQKKIEQWKNDGVLLSGGLCRDRPVQALKLKGDMTTTELIRSMRADEG